MEKLIISEEIAKMIPIWEEFITDLGYSKKKAKLFAEGYAEKLKTLPILEKMSALAQPDDECMTSGFEKAGINEDKAHKKFAKQQ